jgi:hypothetical protein
VANPLGGRYRYHAHELKIHPEIGLACLRATDDDNSRLHLERELRLWYLMRLVDHDGCGWLSVTDLQHRLGRLAVEGLGPSTVRRLLRSGDGIFWHLHAKGRRRYVRVAGVEAVARHFEVYHLGAPVYVPVEDAEGLQSWRGAIVAAFHAQRAGSQTWTAPISRGTLESLTGYARCTIYRWEQALGDSFQSRRNAAVAEDEWPRDIDPPQGCYIDKVVLNDDTELITLLGYLPNSYWSEWQLAPRGMLRKVNASLKRLPSVGVNDDFTRIFWCDPKATNRALTGLREGAQTFIYGATIRGREPPMSRGGAALWTWHGKENGEIRNRRWWL